MSPAEESCQSQTMLISLLNKRRFSAVWCLNADVGVYSPLVQHRWRSATSLKKKKKKEKERKRRKKRKPGKGGSASSRDRKKQSWHGWKWKTRDRRFSPPSSAPLERLSHFKSLVPINFINSVRIIRKLFFWIYGKSAGVVGANEITRKFLQKTLRVISVSLPPPPRPTVSNTREKKVSRRRNKFHTGNYRDVNSCVMRAVGNVVNKSGDKHSANNETMEDSTIWSTWERYTWKV